MRGLSLFLVLALVSSGCTHLSGQPSGDARFQSLADEFVATHFSARPLQAVGIGWHQYDGRFVLPEKAILAAEAGRLKRFDAAFRAIPVTQLSPARRHDLRLLQAVIAGERWTYETQRLFWRNPMFYAGGLWYAPGLDVSVYLKRDFKPLTARIADISAVLRQAPAFFAAARNNLEPVLPKPFVETAIAAAHGAAAFLENDVARAATTVADPALRADFADANQAAVDAFLSYANWLKTERLANADSSFALGRDGYIAMLKSELIDLTPEQILEIGLRELRAEQQRFAKAAALIDPARQPVEVYRTIQIEHPTADSLLPETRKNLDAIRQFLIDHSIISIPGETRPRVAETLPPFRSSTFASMDTPGPFEKKATEAYYYVTPVEPHWTPQQAEQWLTAFNYYATDVISIHEAYPGHYVQFLALNASPAGTVAKVFSSYPFVEGWAHYAEQMMIEEGFGQPSNPAAASPEGLAKAAKYRLAQSNLALLRLCRLCCSIKLHCQGMTVDEATRFFMDNCYYEEKPARQEAVRGTSDPGYLYYTLGKLMILKLRRDWQAQESASFTLQRFHDELLRHGAPPLRLLREIMLKDPKQWSELL
jgi:uncharacterized protein (DUF885 family)